MGLTARTNQPIHSEDLKFILSDTDVLPGFLKQTNDEFTFSSTETGNSKPDFPKYPTGIQFTSEYKSQLKFLQKRGFISIKSNQIWFNHPTYREAAKHLFFLDDIITSNNLNLFINRSLATLNPKSSACCAEQMRFIFDKTENPDTKKMILDLAFKAVQKSIFPGVRDKLFAFILDNINEFSGDHQEKVFRQLEYDFDANDIYWEDDIAYLGPRKIALPGEYGKKTEDLRQILEDINHQQVNISSIWNYIIGLQFNRIEKLPDQKGIIRILNVDEVFIRKRFALLIFSKSFPDDKVLEIIFHDEHPSVISSAIKGAIMGCPTYTENQKEKITNYINEAFKDPHVVIRSNNFMTSFSIDYGSESIAWKDFDKNEQRVMWDFWSSFFPNFLDNYPEDLRISNTGRFHAIFRDGLEYLSSLQGYKISKAFFKWIDKQLKFRMLDEFELDVMSFLIDVTENDEPIRYDLFRDILSHESSDLVACSFAEVIDRWDYLTKQEKDFCMNFLGFDRIDSRWMSAIALTQNKVPKRIQDYFFNEPNLFEKDTHVIVNSFDNDLLQDCLNIFCGYPQPFWWLGFHHRNRDFWYEVILWVVENEYKVGFEISLREIISAEVNGSNKFGDKGKEVWTKLCNDTKRKDLLLDRLLFETASTTYNTDSTKELWSPLIEVYKKENNIERLLDGIESHINNIQNKVKNGLYEIFGTEFLVEYLLPRFPADNLVVRSLLLFSDEDNRRGSLNNSKAREIIDNILEGIDSRDLKLIDTFNILQNVINKKSEEYPSLEKLSKLARHKRSVRMNRERLTEEYEINNWNHVHEN